MLPVIGMLGLPFLACVMMVMILGYMGIHVLKREVIFIDIALAQIAAVGAIVAHIAFDAHSDSVIGYGVAFGFVLLMSGFYALVRSRVLEIPLEAVIGVSYAIAAAGALFLVGMAPGGHIHIQEMLAGSILWTTWKDIFTSLVLFSMVGVCFYILRGPMNRISDNYHNGDSNKTGMAFWDFLFYALLGMVITLSVRMAGVVVVFGFLIIPATISAIFSSHIVARLGFAWLFGIFSSLGGLLFAYSLDFSVGPAIMMFLGGELILVSVIVKFCLVATKKTARP